MHNAIHEIQDKMSSKAHFKAILEFSRNFLPVEIFAAMPGNANNWSQEAFSIFSRSRKTTSTLQLPSRIEVTYFVLQKASITAQRKNAEPLITCTIALCDLVLKNTRSS